MHFHAKMPLIAFLGLMHLRVTFMRSIFCGRGCRNNGGVYNCTTVHNSAALLKTVLDCIKVQIPFFSARWRKCSRVFASGACSSRKLMPINLRMAKLLCRHQASVVIGSVYPLKTFIQDAEANLRMAVLS